MPPPADSTTRETRFSLKKLASMSEFALTFVGDMLPYGVIFLLTLMIGYQQGLEAAGALSLAYAYVAIVTAIVCGPNMLSLRRRMPDAASPGAVVAAALTLRATVIVSGAAALVAGLVTAGMGLETISLIILLFIGRLLETAVDGPATANQYKLGALAYFLIRLMAFLVICGITAIGVLTADAADLHAIALYYIIGSAIALVIALISARGLLVPILDLRSETKVQAREFSRFALATILFVGASRLHPMIINLTSGPVAAGQFATVQNLFSSISLAATGVAGVFFWAGNRRGAAAVVHGVPWRWLGAGMIIGSALGIVGGVAINLLFLEPLGASWDLRLATWIMCLSTPAILAQAILSNALVLQRRDSAMVVLSAANAALGIALIGALVYVFGMLGAALSIGVSAILTLLISILVVRKK